MLELIILAFLVGGYVLIHRRINPYVVFAVVFVLGMLGGERKNRRDILVSDAQRILNRLAIESAHFNQLRRELSMGGGQLRRALDSLKYSSYIQEEKVGNKVLYSVLWQRNGEDTMLMSMLWDLD